MDESYVQFHWIVVKNRIARGAFLDLKDAEKFAKDICGKVWVVDDKECT